MLKLCLWIRCLTLPAFFVRVDDMHYDGVTVGANTSPTEQSQHSRMFTWFHDAVQSRSL